MLTPAFLHEQKLTSLAFEVERASRLTLDTLALSAVDPRAATIAIIPVTTMAINVLRMNLETIKFQKTHKDLIIP